MNQDTKEGWQILLVGLILVLTASPILIFGLRDIPVVAPCVDGQGAVNLEGIMCEKGESEIFGYEEDTVAFMMYMVYGMVGSLIGSLMVMLVIMNYISSTHKSERRYGNKR